MDHIDLDRRAAIEMERIFAAISVQQWLAPTPCPDWTVYDVLAHVVAGNVKCTGIAEGDDWTAGVPAVDVGDDPAVTYRRTVDALLKAWRHPGALEREIELPRGRGKAELALSIHLGETLVHGWDLAQATGQRPAFETEVVEASLASFQRWLPPNRPGGGAFADASRVADDAEPIDRLAAYLGRDLGARHATDRGGQ